MTKVTAEDFSAEISSAIMNNGEMGIQNVLTQYIFGEKKFLYGLFDNTKTDRDRLEILSQIINDIKIVYKNGGEPQLVKYVERLRIQSIGLETL